MTSPPAISQVSDSGILAYPGLQRRSALRDRRPLALRRHTARVATRFAVLLTGDIIAILIARVIAIWLNVETSAGAQTFGSGQTFGGSSPLVTGGRRMAFLGLMILVAIFSTGGHSRHRALNQPVRLFVAVAGACLINWAGMIARGYWPDVTLPLVATAGTLWICLLIVRQIAEWFLQHVWPRQKGAAGALLVGSPDKARRFERAIGAAGGDYRVVGYLAADGIPDDRFLGTIDELTRCISQYDAEAVVVCAELPATRIEQLIEECLHSGCQILYPARAVKVYGLRPALVWHHDQPFFELGSPVLKARALISKRIVDVLVSSVLLILLAPVLLLIALAIRLDSPGSPFFFQERAGLGGKRFRMIKFRTMRDGADYEKEQLAHLNHTGDTRLFKIRDDPRTTRLGAFLRRWSLDELPQLINVFIGEMSLVGPRPFFESDFRDYEDHHFRRLDAKPGITGLWQVSGRSEVLDFEDVVYLDRQYIEQWSFWLDTSILFRTIPAVLGRTGAF
jgi:exopolysaccharide biosynthesis polyprenyl glycosylphosphotransferase